MKILFVLGSRGEWGYIKPLIKELIKNNIHYAICATNMILLTCGYLRVANFSDLYENEKSAT